MMGRTKLSIFNSAIIAGGTYGTDTNINVEWVTGKEGKTLKITFYPETARELSKIAVSNIETPEIGGKPQTTGFISGSKSAKVSLYKWLDAEKHEFTGAFEYKDTYYLWLKLEAAAGYTFSEEMAEGDVDTGDCTGTFTELRRNAPDGPGTSEGDAVAYICVMFKTGKAPEITPTPIPDVTATPVPEATATPVPAVTAPPVPADSATPVPETGNYTATDGNIYDLSGEGSAIFTKLTGSSETVTVPDSIEVNGETVKVTAIANKAFYKNKKIKTIKIGKNIKTIGKSAFEGCTKLKTVKGGANVKVIKDKAFSGDTALKTFPTMNKLQTIGAYAFRKCVKLTKFTIGKKVKSIGKNAFIECKALKKITITSTLLTNKNVKSGAFKGINARSTIICPKKKLKAYKKFLSGKSVPKTAKIK